MPNRFMENPLYLYEKGVLNRHGYSHKKFVIVGKQYNS